MGENLLALGVRLQFSQNFYLEIVARLYFLSFVMSKSAEIILVFISSFAWFRIPHGEIIALFPPLEFDLVLPFFKMKTLLFFALFVVRGCPFTYG